MGDLLPVDDDFILLQILRREFFKHLTKQSK